MSIHIGVDLTPSPGGRGFLSASSQLYEYLISMHDNKDGDRCQFEWPLSCNQSRIQSELGDSRLETSFTFSFGILSKVVPSQQYSSNFSEDPHLLVTGSTTTTAYYAACGAAYRHTTAQGLQATLV